MSQEAIDFRDEMLSHTTVIFYEDIKIGDGVLTIIRLGSRCFLLTCHHCVKDTIDKDLSKLQFLMQQEGTSNKFPNVKSAYYNKSLDLAAFEVDLSFFDDNTQKKPIDISISNEVYSPSNYNKTMILQSFSQKDGKNVIDESTSAEKGIPRVTLVTTAVVGEHNWSTSDSICGVRRLSENVNFHGFSGSAVYRELTQNRGFSFYGIAYEWNKNANEVKVIHLERLMTFLNKCLEITVDGTYKIEI